MDKRVVAAFDFDGTITYNDTLLPFLMTTVGPVAAIGNFSRVLPSLMAYSLGLIGRQRAKEACLAAFYAGMPHAEFEDLGRRFSLEKLDQRIRPESRERIAWHRNRGDQMVVVSASIETYLKAWAEKEGFAAVLGSRLEVIDGKVTGKLLGKNCREDEKVRRLEEFLGPRDGYTLYAYGNSDGDKQMLAFADYAFYKKMS